jgi:hypothetical protein
MSVASPNSCPAWAICLPLECAAAALAFRLVSQIEVRSDETTLWLRGAVMDDALQQRLRGLPASARYAWTREDNTLRPLTSRLASEKLPTDGWQALRAWAAVQLPTAVLPARRPSPVGLELVPASQARPVNAWIGSLTAFAEWTSSAPLVRLARLRFAVCADGRCLVLGAPPPSIRGRVLVADDDIIVPAGLTWRPHATSMVVRRTFGVTAGTTLFWDEAGVRLLPAELFVSASRSAARASVHAFTTPRTT